MRSAAINIHALDGNLRKDIVTTPSGQLTPFSNCAGKMAACDLDMQYAQLV